MTRKIEATSQVVQFMGELAGRYTASVMHALWHALELMISRYGIVFVADAIGKDRSAAELALFRYGRRRSL